MKFDIFFPVERTYDAMTLGCHRYLQVKESKIISLMSFKMVITYTRIYGFRNLKSILQSFLIASSFFSCFLCAPPPHPLLFFNLLKSPLFSNQLIDSIVSSCSLQFGHTLQKCHYFCDEGGVVCLWQLFCLNLLICLLYQPGTAWWLPGNICLLFRKKFKMLPLI